MNRMQLNQVADCQDKEATFGYDCRYEYASSLVAVRYDTYEIENFARVCRTEILQIATSLPVLEADFCLRINLS